MSVFNQLPFQAKENLRSQRNSWKSRKSFRKL